MLSFTQLTKNAPMIKLFLGFHQSTELNIHLNQSQIWKEISVIRLSSPEDLVEVIHEGKLYIGAYLPHPQTTLDEIQLLEKTIRDKLHFYCPEYKNSPAKTLLFPQVFIQ